MKLNAAEIIDIDNMNYFKQFNIYKTIHFPNSNINLKKEINCTSTINIVSAKFIDTPKGTSIEGQHLTGKKLVILGLLNVNLFLNGKCKYEDKAMKNIKIPFSEFIVLPTKICEDKEVNLRYLIEEVIVRPITKHDILISSVILLQYIDEYILEEK
ncbi:hypothetical protein [Clostridium felsineum]|uniref:Uncharacterized protein n=1 Tax=Clostridium felsineum TaxID=36839 RepID=A0A1S8L978_9CLOT|nr:hypothetical protein [Clostridium felsineum]URZ05078.1 hypothetical protein CLROS_004020 [Clostridium felsineum]URZ10119.1 hypothetical protein CROST_008270 [Clostridium felsineum]